MRIIILGAGQVGASVAEALLTEHDRGRARMIVDEALARLDLPEKAGH